MIKAILDTNSVILPSNYDLVRWPPRLPEHQQVGYFDRFDFHVVFADIFESDKGDEIIAVGPPYLNLKEHLPAWKYVFDEGAKIDGANIKFAELNRASRTSFPMPVAGQNVLRPSSLTVQLDGISLNTLVGKSYNDVFDGRNVLMTMNRDNHLHNIRDWITIHHATNDINAVLIFDNRSKSYTKKELLETIASVRGIEVAIVVDWPHPYGVPGGNHQKWDSDFGQYTAWETARWRYFQRANSVMISDVDEIAATESGKPCWQAAEESSSGVYYYPLLDVSAVPRADREKERIRKHSDYWYIIPGTEGSYKYTYIPSKLKANQQLLVHSVTHAPNPKEEPGFARHFQGLHRAWRDGSFGYTYDERLSSHSEEQVDARLGEIFGNFEE